MPSKATHNAAVLITASGVGVALWMANRPLHAAYGIASGVAFTPDLDLAENYDKGLWGLAWWPYGKLFKHRGASHWYVIGSVVRLLYFALIASLTILAFGRLGGIAWLVGWLGGYHPILRTLGDLLMAQMARLPADRLSLILTALRSPASYRWALGVIVADAIHIKLDRVVSRWKENRNGK
jgi:uncharacterized metal-binding protein